MSFDFPNNPLPGQVFQTAGPAYTWDGVVWKMTGTTGVLTADSYNRIVNPAMQHSQEQGRGGSASNGSYPADQWYYGNVGPTTNLGLSYAGNPNYLQLWNGTGTFSPAAGSLNWMQQIIEGGRVADFGWGTGAALPVVLRFRAWTNIASPFVFGVAVSRTGGSYSFVQNFTATSIPTDFVMPIPGATVGTWPTDNTASITAVFCAMAGSTYITSSPRTWVSGNFLAATGVGNLFAAQNQALNIANIGLYLDPLNTGLPPPFVMPDYANELAACKRYWQRLRMDLVAMAASAGAYHGATYPYPVEMRVAAALATNADGTPSNITTATFDSGTAFNCRNFINSTAAGIYAMAGRTGTANARM